MFAQTIWQTFVLIFDAGWLGCVHVFDYTRVTFRTLDFKAELTANPSPWV